MRAVNTIGNSNKADAFFSEQNLCIKAYFQIISADSAHILDDNTFDFSFFNVSSQLLPIRSVKVCAAIPIIGIVSKVRKPLFFGILFKHFLLVYNAVTVSIQFIIS